MARDGPRKERHTIGTPSVPASSFWPSVTRVTLSTLQARTEAADEILPITKGVVKDVPVRKVAKLVEPWKEIPVVVHEGYTDDEIASLADEDG